MQFENQPIPCLRTLKRENQIQEQTQELRISDGMPDIGSIIGVWGQTILRGKEWQTDGISVNGGTMIWVLYEPEEGGAPQCVESWLPFQMGWSLPETRHDGTIFTQCQLLSADARSLSARKMMLRTNVSVLAWVMEPSEQEVYTPSELPQDVQLRFASYPMQLPIEAGEKAFTLEETLNLPASMPPMEELISYTLQPEITEDKIMGDKVVFRGNALLHIRYRADDGSIYSWDFDLPFTQYSELAADYDPDTQAMLWPCVTALELEKEEQQLNMKAGLVCQYRISSRTMVQVVTDAYSPRRSVVPVGQSLELPGILETKDQHIHAQLSIPTDAMRLMDVQFSPQPLQKSGTEDGVDLELSGRFQILYYDMEGKLRNGHQTWQQKLPLPVGSGAEVEGICSPAGKTQGNLLSGSAQLSADMKLTTETVSASPVAMVTGLELGELQLPDPHRPSLILRRAGNQSLWDIAKETGSTVEAIQAANQLEAEPESTKMLLIPVM